MADLLSDDPRVADLVNIAVKVVADPLRVDLAAAQAECVALAKRLAELAIGSTPANGDTSDAKAGQ